MKTLKTKKALSTLALSLVLATGITSVAVVSADSHENGERRGGGERFETLQEYFGEDITKEEVQELFEAVEVSVSNVEDGVEITLTSDDESMAAFLQDTAAERADKGFHFGPHGKRGAHHDSDED